MQNFGVLPDLSLFGASRVSEQQPMITETTNEFLTYCYEYRNLKKCKASIARQVHDLATNLHSLEE